MTANPSPPAYEVTPTASDNAVWEELRRSLQFPTIPENSLCPQTEASWAAWGATSAPGFKKFMIGKGPVQLSTWGPDGAEPSGDASAEGWYLKKEIWVAEADYQGPILIRGRQLDGSHEVYFGYAQSRTDKQQTCGDRTCTTNLQLAAESGGTGPTPGIRHWGGYIMLQAPGCYAFQIDGNDFSEVVVYQYTDNQVDKLHLLPNPETLPHELQAVSGIHIDTEEIRLALTSSQNENLWVRLDVEPTQSASLNLANGPEAQREETEVGSVLWSAHPEYGWPEHAVWNDGHYRYEFSVLPTDVGADDWSKANLLQLIEALADAV